MLSLAAAQSIQETISFLVVYICTVIFTGCLQAWVALKMGDPTAQEEGYLTLDPVVHIDASMLIFALLRLIVVRDVPMNPLNVIGSRFARIKIALMYFSASIASLLLMVLSLLVLLLFFGGFIVPTPLVPLFAGAAPWITPAPWIIVVRGIIMQIAYFNAFFACLHFLFTCLQLFLRALFAENPEYQAHAPMIALFSSILLVVLLQLTISYWGNYLRSMMLMVEYLLAYALRLI